MKRSDMKQRRNPIPGGILLGAVTALVWTIVCSIVIAKLIHGEMMDFSSIGWAAMGIQLTAGLIAGYTAWGKAKKSRLAVALGAGGGYYLTLLMVTALFFGGIYTGMGVTGIMVLLGAFLSVVPALIGQGRKGTGHYKIRTA